LGRLLPPGPKTCTSTVPLPAGETAVMLVAVGLAYQRQGRYQHFGPGQMIFFPAASLLMLYTMVRSMAVVLWKGGITWRGTFYPLSELRAQRNSRNA